MYICDYSSWNRVFEQKESSINNLVIKAKENDSDEVKSNKIYDAVMAWFDNEGPSKGKPIMSKDEMIKSLKYWTGNLSSEMRPKEKRIEEVLEMLSDDKNIKAILKKLEKNGHTGYDIDVIKDAAIKLKNKFNELHKSGKYIGASHEEKGTYQVHTTKPGTEDTYPTRLGFIPFSVIKSKHYNGLDRYKGKDWFKSSPLKFKAWYKKIEEDLDGMLAQLDNTDYIKVKTLGITENDKVAILNKFDDKTRGKRDIADALKIKWWPSAAKTVTNKEKNIIQGEPETEYVSFSFPKEVEIAKTFFLDDKASIDPKFKNSINDFVKDIRQQLPEGAEVTEVNVQCVASTSKVPSSLYRKTDANPNYNGNHTLVDLRIKAIQTATSSALGTYELDTNVKYDLTSGKLPNQGEEYDRETYGKSKRQADPVLNTKYEELYGPYRYSGVRIEIGYKITTQTDEETEISTTEVSGKWNSVISWHKPPRPPWNPPIIFKPRKGKGLYNTKPGTDCFDFCAAYN